MEFQALQAGHCPIHLDDSYPHSLQKNAVVLAFAMIASSYLWNQYLKNLTEKGWNRLQPV